MLLSITTTGKIVLLVVACLFMIWALITAIWIPKRNPDFPATLTAFLLVSSLFFIAQMGAVYWVTGTQEVEHETAEQVHEEEQEAPPTTTVPAGDPAPGVDGDIEAGKEVFEASGCGSCHTLSDAGASGSIGPNLDEAKPNHDLVVERVTKGQGVMPAFPDLSEQQVEDVAAYVSSVAGSS